MFLSKKVQLIISLAGYVFGVAFSLMVMIFLFVAHLNGTGITYVVWNHFAEFMIETVLFSIAFIIVLIGFWINYKNVFWLMKSDKSQSFEYTGGSD